MRRSRTVLAQTLCLCVMAAPDPAQAQDPSEVAQLRAALEAQQALNQKLLARLEALEAGQAALLEKIETGRAEEPADDAAREELESLTEEIREHYFDLQERIDLLPTLSGYFDFEYRNDDREDSPGEFRHHRLSLHLSREWQQWRLFSEFEWEYGAKVEGDGDDELEEVRGEIKLEQAWSEYVHSNLLTIRGGLILTPGYWNVNHYPNVVLATRRPLLVKNVFRESFVGLMAYGTKSWGDIGITYHGYVGNGQSVYFTKHDDNEGKAVGGKLTLHLPTKEAIDTCDLSFDVYHESPSGEDRVFTWGVEAQLRRGPWELLSEFAAKDGSEDRTGFYLQQGHRFNEQWAAFYRYDLLSIRHRGEQQEHTIGVNYRPIPDVSLKLEYFYAIHSEAEDHNGVAASVAVAF